jgi:hypothetical protein
MCLHYKLVDGRECIKQVINFHDICKVQYLKLSKVEFIRTLKKLGQTRSNGLSKVKKLT